MRGEAGRNFGASGEWSTQANGRTGTTGWRMGLAQYPLPRGATPHRVALKLLIVVEESAIMKELVLTCRYSREYTAPEVPCREENFEWHERTVTVPASQAALVLVDCWDRHPVESFVERATQVARQKILPTVEACREAGVVVAHAPSPAVAQKYPQWLKYAGNEELFGPEGGEVAWPPAEFRSRVHQYDDSPFGRPAEPLLEQWLQDETLFPAMRIMDFLEPQAGDFVVASGAQLHWFCRDQQILHLFYAGFAANICIQLRDYGIRAMHDRGYHTILLRDCTTAIEGSHTLEGQWLLEAAIFNIELKVGCSTTAQQLQAACRE